MARKKVNNEEVKETKVIEEVVEETIEEVKEEKPEFPKTMKVIAKGGLRIRDRESLQSKQVAIVPFEQEVEVLKIEGEWARVKDGFMLLKFLQ